MRKNDINLILDKLRFDLDSSPIELIDVRWDITKNELGKLLMKSGPKKTTVASIFLVSGIGLGIYGVRIFPKTRIVKAYKFLGEYMRASKRLNKILIEESYRIDEAVKTEEQFLNMMGDEVGIVINIEVVEKVDGRKTIDYHMKFKKKKETTDD